MTAAEILRNVDSPADDELIDKAIADLDVKIWEWADALKSAHTQLRSAFAVRPAGRPSAALYDDVVGLPAAAAAAHIPSPPPMPKEWTAPPASAGGGQVAPPPPPASEWSAPPPPEQHDWSAVAQQRPSQFGGHGASAHTTQAPPASSWPQPSDPHTLQQPSGANAGVMSWPTAPSGSNWPEPSSTAGGPQAWPTWTPSDASQDPKSKKAGSNVRATKAPKATRPVVAPGPTPEERAQKAAAEEALLSELDDAIARRVRLLRRLDPDTAIEKLIEKAKQGHAEGAAAPPAASKDDKASSSWWRRK